MNRSEEFKETCKRMSSDAGLGNAEMQTIYLERIAYYLAIIAECLEKEEGAE